MDAPSEFKEIKLRTLLGEVMSVSIDGFSKLSTVKLVGIETSGLWFESQEFTNELLSALGIAASEKTLVVFFLSTRFDT